MVCLSLVGVYSITDFYFNTIIFLQYKHFPYSCAYFSHWRYVLPSLISNVDLWILISQGTCCHKQNQSHIKTIWDYAWNVLGKMFPVDILFYLNQKIKSENILWTNYLAELND
jgi:hypothetical protein